MAMCNIPSTNDDPAYRYKMPKIASKKEGRGNGSKTCIVNMSDVARALKCPPEYTTKWFGYELGAQSTYTNKEGEGERAIVNGHHETPVFQTMLDKFIETYILCPNCKLPEIDMGVKKDKIMSKCAACGWTGELDPTHKLATFILKSPPDPSGLAIAVASSKDDKSKKDKRKEREEKRKAKAEKGDGDDEEDGEDGDEKEKKEKKDKKEKKEKGEKKEKKEKKEKGEGEEGKKEKKEKKEKGEKKDKKDKKEKKTKKEKTAKEDKDDDDDDDDDSDKENERGGNDNLEYNNEECKSVVTMLEDKIKKDGKVKTDEFFEELRMQQIAKVFDNKVRLYIALEALFTEGSMDAKAVETQSKTISKCVSTGGSMSGSDVLFAFGAYLEANSKALKGYPMVLKAIYSNDWASEEAILGYYKEDSCKDPCFADAKKTAAPFLKWLETTSDSEDDDSDSSDDK